MLNRILWASLLGSLLFACGQNNRDSDASDGRGLSLQSFGEMNSDKRYTFEAYLSSEGASLELVSHADQDAQHGVHIVFTRKGNDVVVQAKANNESTPVVLTGIHPRSLNLVVEVHNTEDTTHILIWDQNEKHRDEDSALWNSEQTNFEGRGKGCFWKFVAKDAVVKNSSISDASQHTH